jgi:hypothetical protein
MNQKQASTIMMGLGIALAVLVTGVLMAVGTIIEQADAQGPGTGFCIRLNKFFGASGREAAENCTPAGDR